MLRMLRWGWADGQRYACNAQVSTPRRAAPINERLVFTTITRRCCHDELLCQAWKRCRPASFCGVRRRLATGVAQRPQAGQEARTVWPRSSWREGGLSVVET